MKNELLKVPMGKIDVVLDTDAYNEIDDQFAIAYMLKSKEKLNVKAICAAPFFIEKRSESVKDGMEKSYDEILKLLSLMGESVDTYRGAEDYLKDEKTPAVSEASKKLSELCRSYSPENPLYVVAIGAITNVASALLINPDMKNRCVVVWLGGNARHFPHTKEFNMRQDVAAARVVMQSGVPFIQLPCIGVVDSFRISKPELEWWLVGKNPVSDYLARNTIEEAESYAAGKPWTRVIWDVTAVAWLLNDNERFMKTDIVKTRLPSYEHVYEERLLHDMGYVYHVERDALMCDLLAKLTK